MMSTDRFVIGSADGRSTMGRLSGKVALITGGEGSVGMASARVFVAEGAKVALVGIDEGGLRAGAAELGPDDALSVVADVTDAGQVQAAVAATLERFGGLDIVFSNAGISGVVGTPISEYPDEVFDRTLAVHVRGAYLVCKHTLPVINDGGSVIITSSVVGLTSAPGIVAYATAKHAQVGLMRTAAREMAPRGVRVNTLHPGPIDNEFQHAIEMEATGAPRDEATRAFDTMIPLGRHAAPDEIARTALFLASDDSSFVTGSTIPVDGGMNV
jgi:NAD(P)-dependent dehydrogenase (short-subunit alcohol dehydrogenase family)